MSSNIALDVIVNRGSSQLGDIIIICLTGAISSLFVTMASGIEFPRVRRLIALYHTWITIVAKGASPRWHMEIPNHSFINGGVMLANLSVNSELRWEYGSSTTKRDRLVSCI